MMYILIACLVYSVIKNYFKYWMSIKYRIFIWGISFGRSNMIRIYFQPMSVVDVMCIYYLTTVTIKQNTSIFDKGAPNFQSDTGL